MIFLLFSLIISGCAVENQDGDTDQEIGEDLEGEFSLGLDELEEGLAGLDNNQNNSEV